MPWRPCCCDDGPICGCCYGPPDYPCLDTGSSGFDGEQECLASGGTPLVGIYEGAVQCMPCGTTVEGQPEGVEPFCYSKPEFDCWNNGDPCRSQTGDLAPPVTVEIAIGESSFNQFEQGQAVNFRPYGPFPPTSPACVSEDCWEAVVPECASQIKQGLTNGVRMTPVYSTFFDEESGQVLVGHACAWYGSQSYEFCPPRPQCDSPSYEASDPCQTIPSDQQPDGTPCVVTTVFTASLNSCGLRFGATSNVVSSVGSICASSFPPNCTFPCFNMGLSLSWGADEGDWPACVGGFPEPGGSSPNPVDCGCTPQNTNANEEDWIGNDDGDNPITEGDPEILISGLCGAIYIPPGGGGG